MGKVAKNPVGVTAAKTSKTRKPERYFNSKLNPIVKSKKEKARKSKSNDGKSKATPSGVLSRPKPKRLKKGPFKVQKESENKMSGSSSKTKFKRKSSDNRKGSTPTKRSDTQEVDVNDTDQTPTTKKRIENIKKSKGSGQAKFQKQEVAKVIVKSEGKWYQSEDAAELPKVVVKSLGSLSKEENKKLNFKATKLYEKDVTAYKQVCSQGVQKSDFQWMEKMMKVGTLPDKMAAFVVRIQDSPVHNLHHLQSLISMVKVQSKQQCLMAADTLKDLFLEDLLPPERKLISFDKRGSELKECNDAQLITLIFEDRLKACYLSYISALKAMSVDTVEKIRAKAVSLIQTLLTAHPEQEALLLQLLVNKLGDTMKKVASRALFYLNALLEAHPRMKLVVIDEVERLLFRNNIGKRPQYYGICFLNSINLKNEHPEVASKLITVYVAFFKGCVKTGDIESKMMSALLTGVNKSYPAARDYGYKFTENTDTLYKIAYLSNFNITIQALSILFQLTDVEKRPNDADRYYRVLYKELLRPDFSTTSHSDQFLNLIFKSMKCDNKLNRVLGFTKRLLMICQNVQPNLACAILFMLSEVSKVHKGIIRSGRIPECEAVSEQSSDEEEDLSKNEEMLKLAKISNVQIPLIDSTVNDGPPEISHAAPIIEPEVEIDQNLDKSLSDAVKIEYKYDIKEYDPHARNPCFCGAEFSLSHEIATLASHYHPSVALFAETLMHNKHIKYDGNPLKDFTLGCFLDRFVFKNAKKPKLIPGGRVEYQPKGLRRLAVNSTDYLNNDEQDIPVDERFFYRYFKEKKAAADESSKDDESETESIGDDEFDELMANYFKSGKKKGGEDDDDEEEDEEELDFAANFTVDKKKSKGKKQEGSDEEEEDEVDEIDEDFAEGDEDDEDMDADEMLDLDDDDIDFQDEEGLEVFEEDFDEMPLAKKSKKAGKGLDMFAPAEEFAEMLEANADDIISGPNQLISKDNANPKQLKWEMERDRWIKGYKGSSKTAFKGKKNSKGRKKGK